MKPTLLVVSIALALGTLAGCDRNPTPTPSTSATPPPNTAGTGSSASNTPTTPANVGAPSQSEKKAGASPVQGQVDPKESAQRKDFQQKGDGAGPKPGG